MQRAMTWLLSSLVKALVHYARNLIPYPRFPFMRGRHHIEGGILLPNHNHLDIILEVEGPFAVATLRIVDEQEREPTIGQRSAEAHALVVGEVEVEWLHMSGPICQEMLVEEAIRVQRLEIRTAVDLFALLRIYPEEFATCGAAQSAVSHVGLAL